MVLGLQIFRINLAIKFHGFENAIKVITKDAGGIGLKHNGLVAELEDADDSLVFVIHFTSIDVNVIAINYGS